MEGATLLHSSGAVTPTLCVEHCVGRTLNVLNFCTDPRVSTEFSAVDLSPMARHAGVHTGACAESVLMGTSGSGAACG